MNLRAARVGRIAQTKVRPHVVRRQVAAPAQNILAQAQGQPASFVPVTLATLYNYPVSNLAQLQTIMSSAGLTGLGDFKRHMATRTGRWI